MKKYLIFVSNYLFHPFPVIRRVTAEEFYLIIMNEEKSEKDELESLLLNTAWSETLIPELKARINNLVEIIFSCQ